MPKHAQISYQYFIFVYILFLLKIISLDHNLQKGIFGLNLPLI